MAAHGEFVKTVDPRGIVRRVCVARHRTWRAAHPLTTGVSSRAPHSDHEPSYSAFGSLPSASSAIQRMAAVTPEPQLVIRGFAISTLPASKAAESLSA